MNQQLIDNNYLYIPNFISTDHANHLYNKFVNFCIEEELPGDPQAENSHAVYNYIDFLELLCERTPQINHFLGEPVLPTYTYARVYKEGSDLTIHKDRDACEISLTLHLAGDTEWPIYIKKPNGDEVSLNLKSGDAMMYLGCDAEHWREQFQGKEYVQVFLHYVRSRGDRSYAFFDNKDKETKKLAIEKNAEPAKKLEKPKKEYKKNIEDYIQVFDNVLSDELCDRILNEFVNSNDWQPTIIGSGVLDTKIRNTDTIGLSFQAVIQQNPEIRKALDEELFNVAATAIQKYNEVFSEARIEQDSGYELLRYNEGQFYVQHTDSFLKQPRAVSCSFAINDDYEGGEFAFWNREKKVFLKKGSVLMFPSNFMYPHEIMPVTKGTRYSIITWFI
jgi:Rps23 Pro-64 3,4-dihydroxylase Tpa1-like proline 4-hydroxylase